MRLVPFLATCLAAALLAAAPPRPKLVVVISVDQLSEELVSRWGRDLPGGLGRLCRDSTAFVDAYQDHGYTETGPGHAAILTGCDPMHSGIPENLWFDRGLGRETYCVEDPAGAVLGAGGVPVGPAHLACETLGERLQARIKGSRSFAVAGKDRAAILMAGHRSQGVYWFAGEAGFTTSKAYAQALPDWLRTCNAAFLERTRDESLYWAPLDPRGLPPAATYTVHGEPLTMALPRSIHAVGAPMDAAAWTRFRRSPFFDSATLDAAWALAEGERLGEGPGVDLLALGLSATDHVGHAFGNGGPEMLDHLRRLDRDLGAFLDRLRAKVPDAWVVLTADHGAADFPERLQAQGIPAIRFDLGGWVETFNRELTRRLGGGRAYFKPSGSPELYLEPGVPGGPSRARILEAAVTLAKASPDVAEACTGDDLGSFEPDPAEGPDRRSLRTKLRLSYVPGRSGDLLLAFKPFCFPDGDLATHGSPYDYDRRVPLLFWGPWRPERRTEPVRIVDLAPTLARELGLAPSNLDGRALDLRLR